MLHRWAIATRGRRGAPLYRCIYMHPSIGRGVAWPPMATYGYLWLPMVTA